MLGLEELQYIGEYVCVRTSLQCAQQQKETFFLRFGLGVSGLVETLPKFGRTDPPIDSKSREALCCFLDRRGASCSVMQSGQTCVGPRNR